MNEKIDIAIVGIVGVPARYGGFETLVEYLLPLDGEILVYCSSKHYVDHVSHYKEARLKYIPMDANGWQSIFYDQWALFHAGFSGARAVLVLGVSGALIFPLIKLMFPMMRVVVNVDGQEWKRAKWGKFAKWFLKLSENISVKFADVVIADNEAISDYVLHEYGNEAEVIAYGGDHALIEIESSDKKYAFALCRIEPENNVHLILEAFQYSPVKLVFVGNWESSDYGVDLKTRYSAVSNVVLKDPIYDLSILSELRAGCSFYVHGHSAGGTNPSLVEMMHFEKPIVAFDCVFNRFTLDNEGLYFVDAHSLNECVENINSIDVKKIKAIACKNYVWSVIRAKYISLLS
ncbi:DUF1972 domain-containing protein [Pseudomonadales bacterium]|nr:DUF1972 domain-containing protein [Pseudomonadales bacterium]